jgi:bis(5'-nucleosyl)-tetraphosphatase (symmetrical)
MATYAIGDVQGCYDSLRRLLDACAFDPAADRLWFVGDLVNRGPHSLAVLRFVRALGDAAIAVLGNHDLYLLMVAEGVARKKGRDDTLDEVLAAGDRDDLLAWLRNCPLCHVDGDYCLVHAGLLPQWTTAEARALAAEVEAQLSGPDYREALAHLWGSEPVAWSAELHGHARTRVIVNAMTRMRFCTRAGEMEFKARGDPANAPPGYLPWFEVPGRKSAEAVLVTGHWSALGLKVTPRLLALDSGCLWGRHLSALRLEDRRLFQVACRKGDAPV